MLEVNIGCLRLSCAVDLHLVLSDSIKNFSEEEEKSANTFPFDVGEVERS